MRYTKILLLSFVFLFSTNYIKGQACITPPADGSDNQTVCQNSPIKNIVYTLSPLVSGATATGLPVGVIGTYSPGLFIISGTPTVYGTFSYRVTVTGGICTGSPNADGKITVIQLPPATITSSDPDNIFCAGTLITFTAGPAGAANYNFRINGSSVQNGTSNTYKTRTLTNGQTVDVIVTNSFGCIGTSSGITNTVFAKPTATAANNGPVCPGTALNLTGGPNGMQAYSWSGPNGYSNATQSPQVSASATPSMSGTYTLIVTTTNGCQDTATTNAVVRTPPAVTAANNGPVCAGTTLSLTGGPNNMTYSWSGPNGFGSPQQNPVVSTSATLAMAGTYTLKVTDSNGCQNTASTIAVVNALPVATAANNGPVCIGTTLSLTGGPVGMVYTWTGPNGFTSTLQNPVVSTSATAAMAGTYTLNVINSSGCIGTATTNVVVNPLPVATASSNSPVCVGATLSLMGGPAGMKTYSWSGPNGFTSTLQNPVVSTSATTAMAGTYTLTVTNNNGCLGLASTVVTINPALVAVASNNGPVCVGSALNLTGGPSGMTTYSWTGPNSFTSTQISPQISPAATLAMAGVYTLTVTNAIGCRDTATTRVRVYAVPVSNAGPGGNECDLNFVLGAVPSVGTGLWSLFNGPGTATFTPNASSPTATVTVSAYGTYIFIWTETNGPCMNSSFVTVNFYQRPVANPGTGGSACNLTYALNAVPGLGTGIWTMTGGTGTVVFSPDANTPSATVQVSEYGAKQFTWTQTNGTCSDDSTITVSFYQQPVAFAGAGGTNCGLSYNLRATPSIGTGTWTLDSGPGTATFSPDANQPNATVTITAYGTYVFRWTEINGTCSSSSTVSVIFIEQPAADGGNGGNECDLNFTLNAVQPTSGTGTWTKASGPGNVTFSPDANQYNATVTVSQAGIYDFTWTVVNSQCSSSDIIRVTFNNLPSVNAGEDVIICRGRSAQLNATGTGTFLWSPAGPLNNPNIRNPLATPTTTTLFTVTLTDASGCRNSDQVNVEVRQQPVANAGPDQMLEYTFETDLQASALGSNQTGEWTLLEGDGDLSDKNSPTSHVSKLGLNTNKFIWRVTNNVCPVSSDTVNIVVHNLVIPTLITPNLDGKNDFFVIMGVETFGSISLTVFNRWGVRVYEDPAYDNNWNGVDDNKNPLPDDTYFYVLKPEKGRTIKGYVVIRR
ncbi:MAG: gliding motility-associated C-terminal domain-containing protein [Bacteroidota bacterium]|nr:gliding motility-associated C-terminal domain-containing protein [Bacteroidota bacterium]